MEPASDFELLANVVVGLDASARGRRDLRQHDLPAIARVALQELAEGLELLRQAFGVVEPIDADDAMHGRARLHQATVALGMREIGDIDADREAADGQQPIEQADAAVRHDPPVHAVFQVGDQVGDIGLGLQTDQVIGRERARELLMLGDGHEGLPGRKRNVQEKADGVLGAEPAQLGGEGKQVVVMHPDQVVGAQKRAQLFRQAAVDPDIALEKTRLELCQVQAIVKDRPQHRVAVAQVVSLVIGLRERNGGNASLALEACRGVLGRNLAAPAEPQRRARAHNIGQGNRHAAGLRGFADVGDPVRYQDDAAHARLIRFLRQHTPLRHPRLRQRTAAAKVPGAFGILHGATLARLGYDLECSDILPSQDHDDRHYSCAQACCQLRDNKRAVLTMPAME